MSPYRLAGEMPPAPKVARVAPADLEDDIDSAVACHHLVDTAECAIPRDDGFLKNLCLALIICFSMLGFVLALMNARE